MKVFISSPIQGFEPFRDAAAEAVSTLGHSPIRAEDFGASPDSPQRACLAGVRDSDTTVLLLGARYGDVQESGLSATHEEYREARDIRPVLVFVQEGTTPDPSQHSFIEEVQSWEGGHFTAEFRDSGHLRDKVIRALYDFALANEAVPLDETALASRALELIRTTGPSRGAQLLLGVASGPSRSVLRPAELEGDDLRRFLLAEAITGSESVLTPTSGTATTVKGDAIEFVQENGSGLVRLDETADLTIVQPAVDANNWSRGTIQSLIEEVVTAKITRAIRFSALVLDHIDPAQRVSHVALAVALKGGGYLPWRTQAEQEQSPNAATMESRSGEQSAVLLSPPVRRRAALSHDVHRIAEDLTVRLRREVKG